MPIPIQDMKYVDPTELPALNMFNVILVDNLQDFISWGIKADTSSNYNHSETQRTPNLVDCQEMGSLFKTVPIKQYMIKENILKIWQINNLTADEWNLLNTAVQNDLKGPWYKRFYNYLGIVGQFTGLTWISFPGTCFCSQRVAKYLRMLPRFASVLPENVSPGFEDSFFMSHPELMTCAGFWWSD